MKLEINDSTLVDEIAKRVSEQLKPLIANTNSSKNNELMTVEELSSYLKVKTSFIYDKVHKREIPFHKCGKFPRFRKKFIDIWLQNPYSSELDNFNLNKK
jgi:excisionase family DNA binding protein